jgi:hypothetical protein
MHKEVEETVRHCTVCAKNRVTERKRTSFLKLFPASGPLEFVAMDILGPLPKTERGNRFLLVKTHPNGASSYDHHARCSKGIL